MAKVNVKLRPSGIEGRPGTVYYHVSHKRAVRHITTDIHILPQQWDAQRRRIIGSPECGEAASTAQSRIDSDLARLQRIIMQMELQPCGFTAGDVVKRFATPERSTSVQAFICEQIGFLNDCMRLGTAINYRRALKRLTDFMQGGTLSFADITPQFVERYSDYLQRLGMVRNSLSFHMRILRAVYNKAVRRGLAEQTFPFSAVYTGIDRTRKRAVGEDTIIRLARLELSPDSPLAFARDIFLFSFYTRGMAFVDISYLRRSDIQDGVIRYMRHKTGQQLSIRVEPCIREIIDRYADVTLCRPYIFPILHGDNPAACFVQYKAALRLYNYRLQRLSSMLQLDRPLSSYTSRHSWATMARNRNVPVSVISAGMGHTSERTTQIYLASLESSQIDAANKSLLEAIGSQTAPHR